MVDYTGSSWVSCSLHEDYVSRWRAETGFTHFAICPRLAPGVNFAMLNTSDEWHGTSSLYAVRIAIELGSAEKIILAGCPMDQSGHYYDREDLGLYLETYRKGWLSAYPRIKDIVRSYSGWTRELLGEPTEEWLRG